jgi:hypothetical protein
MWTCALLAFNFRASGLYHNAAKFLSLLSCFVYEIQIKIQKMIVDSYEFSEKKRKRFAIIYGEEIPDNPRERGGGGGKITPVAMPCHAREKKRKEEEGRYSNLN